MAHGQEGWPVILAATLGSIYAVVMLLLLTRWLCMRRRAVVVAVPLEAGGGTAPMLAHPRPTDGSVFKSRTVARPRSAFFAGSTTPGVDLSAIDQQIRMAFVRKVYALLSTMMLVTIGIVVLFISLSFPSWKACTPTLEGPCAGMSDFGYGLISNTWVIWVAFVPLLFMICCLNSLKNRYPINYFALFAFTLIQSAVVAVICVLFYAEGYGEQILIACGVTVGIFLVLTLFTLQSKVDWGFLGPGLVAALFIMIFWSWMTFWLVPYASFAFSQVYSLFGALLFCGFIIYDTNNIMRHFGVDDWLIAAIELYLDVINLFLFLLQLLSGGGRRD